MKSQTVAITIAVLALPIYAQGQPRPNTTTTTLSVPISQEQTDSPLVRAAKSTGRLGKKPGYVITNDTLLRVGASHMSISTSQGAALPAPAPKAPTVTPKQPRPDTKAKVDAEARRRNAQQTSSDYYGESLDPRNVDPAVQEHQMQSQQATPPKPPQN
jgi:hypothetical protein